MTKNLEPIPQNIVWTDNCPTQYKCRQNFLKVATFATNHNSKSILTHKFVQKYRFKGSWDATGKIVKQRILNNKLKYYRFANAWDCYVKLSKYLTKNGEEARRKKFEQYERDGDEPVLKNTTLSTRRTFIGFGTENKA